MAGSLSDRYADMFIPSTDVFFSQPSDVDYGSIWFLEVDPDGREWLAKELSTDRDRIIRKAASSALKRSFYGPGYGENDWMWAPDARLLTQEEEERAPLKWKLKGRNVRIPGDDTYIDGEDDEDFEEEGTFEGMKPWTSPVTF